MRSRCGRGKPPDMDVLAPVKAFDRAQQRHRVLGFPLAVVKKFSDDQAGGLAALIAYYGFFSLFPLLLLFVTILGFVLHGDPSAQKKVVDSALGQFPIIGDQLKVHGLKGNGLGLVVGIVGSLLAGIGVTQATQNAFARVWAVPFKDRPNFLVSRLRGVAILVVLGIINIVATAASGLVTGGLGGLGATIGGIAVSLVLDLLLFFAAFRLLTPRSIETHHLLPGVVLGAVMWAILQAFGGIYIGHTVKNASGTYGLFALVIGLLTWLYLGAQMTLYAAEANVVAARRLWPRSLLGPMVDADERALRYLAKIEERHEEQNVEVTFDEPET